LKNGLKGLRNTIKELWVIWLEIEEQIDFDYEIHKMLQDEDLTIVWKINNEVVAKFKRIKWKKE